MENNTKNIKTYKLVEIPINSNGNSANVSVPKHQTFVVGDKYKIITHLVDKIYECKAYIDVVEEVPDACLDLVVMKPISGYFNEGFELSETDCEFLKLEYEKHLLIFPATYNFKKVASY